MKRCNQRNEYPMGSVSCATMREEDLIPTFLHELRNQLKNGPKIDRATRKDLYAKLHDIERRSAKQGYYEGDDASWDLNEDLFDALQNFAGPYFYFGSHPGDGADYGYWLSEFWGEDFETVEDWNTSDKTADSWKIKVSDLSEVPEKYRGEVAVVNDHGNVTLYRKTARRLVKIWSIV